MKKLGVALSAVLLCAGPLSAAAGLKVFHIGNSLTDQAYGMHDIAKGKGYTPIIWAKFMIPGAPSQWLWEHPGPVAVTGANYSGDVRAMLQNYSWDVVIIQLYPLNGDDGTKMGTYGGNFAELAYKGNPNCQVYVFGSYPERDHDWKVKLPIYNDMAVKGAAGISARFPDRKPTLVIPVMQVFDSIRVAITKGQAGSVTSWQNMFLGDGHANNNGDYLEAIVHFSTVYKADPHGSIISGLFFWTGLYSVSQSYATAVWDAAWTIVQRYPQSGVTGTGVPAALVRSPGLAPSARREAVRTSLAGRSIRSAIARGATAGVGRRLTTTGVWR